MKNRYLLLVYSSCVWLAFSCHFSSSSKQAGGMPNNSAGEIADSSRIASGDMPAQDVPMALLEKLGELYGDNPPAVAGFSVESKNCPDFIDGVYINGKDSLVIRTKGDSATVRKQLEEVLESKDFIVEPCKTYTQKELYAIQEELRKRWMALMETPVIQNVIGAGTRGDYVEIFLIVNTPEKRREFRREVMDSPAFRFNGIETPAENATVGVNDTLGVALRPEYTVYSTESDTAAFILYNHSGTTIHCGEVYFITYEDSAGVWRELPINATFNSLGHWVEDGDSLRYTAYLYPAVHPNRPGRYRFFYDVTVGDRREGPELHMMAEFRLSDDAAELQRARPTPIPDIILDGLSLQEY